MAKQGRGMRGGGNKWEGAEKQLVMNARGRGESAGTKTVQPKIGK